MKFSFVNYLSRLLRPRTLRHDRPKRRPRPLWGPEHLEERVLLNNDTPFILSVAPPDGSTPSSAHPTLQVTYSEAMNVAQAGNKANYLLFDSQNNPISV